MGCRVRALFLPLAATAGLMAAASSASAIGYWNLPGSFCQSFGYGWGAGHHAPLVLGPIHADGWLDPKEVRLPYPPSPYGAYGNCQHACFDAHFTPSRLQGEIERPIPTGAPPRQMLFEAPIEHSHGF